MIRDAYRHELPELVEMMRGYASEAPAGVLGNPEAHDADHVAQVLFGLMAGRGFIVVDDQLRGFLAAIVTPNFWCPKVKELKELAWWVKPEYRNGSLGGRLWHEFNYRATEMLDEGRIDMACTSVLANSPLLDYTKRGYRPLEATFYREQ